MKSTNPRNRLIDGIDKIDNYRHSLTKSTIIDKNRLNLIKYCQIDESTQRFHEVQKSPKNR